MVVGEMERSRKKRNPQGSQTPSRYLSESGRPDAGKKRKNEKKRGGEKRGGEGRRNPGMLMGTTFYIPSIIV